MLLAWLCLTLLMAAKFFLKRLRKVLQLENFPARWKYRSLGLWYRVRKLEEKLATLALLPSFMVQQNQDKETKTLLFLEDTF
jgi:hypothetical protein